jgi:uncharacterized protein GlcG (DUF336 family)
VSTTFEKQSVTMETAHALIAAATREAERMRLAVSVAICDESGILKALARMDGAALLTVSSAQDKAYTAAGFGHPSHRWYPIIKDDPALLHGVVGAIDRLVIFGGGIPLKIDRQVVGAIGVGGGSHNEDREIAEKAVSVVLP